jgi:enoyl-CoA hydratase
MSTVICQTDGRVGIIRLNRPQALNALNAQLMEECTAALRTFEADAQIASVVLAGEGRAFTAGFDLKELAQHKPTTPLGWEQLLRADMDFVMQFWSCRKPTVAAVHGYAIGGGFELALACDVTVAEQGSRMGEPEVKFGSSIAALVLPWLSSPKIAKELLLTGEDRLDAERAYTMGLINKVSAPGAGFDDALAIARRIAEHAPLSVQLTKRAINRSLDIAGMHAALIASVDSAVEIETAAQATSAEFEQIQRTQGLKAALQWRDARAPN